MDSETPKDQPAGSPSEGAFTTSGPAGSTSANDAPAKVGAAPDNAAMSGAPGSVAMPGSSVSPGASSSPSTAGTAPSVASESAVMGSTPDSAGTSSSVFSGGTTMGAGKAAFGGGRKKLVGLIAGIAALLVLGGAGYVFAYYLPNKPENVYATALERTGKGYDKLVDYVGDGHLAKKYTSTDISGTLKLEGKDYSTDGTFSAKGDKNNGTVSLDLGVLTSRVKFDAVIKDVSNSEAPDAYIRLGGIKGYGAMTGVPGLDSLDNQWIVIDHSLLETYSKDLTQESASSKMKLPTEEQLNSAYAAIGNASRKYLFTGETKNSAIEMRKYIGKETVDGKTALHYTVGVNKENYGKFLHELASQLDKSKLNSWVKDNYGKSISEYMNADQTAKDVDTKATADLWVNAKTKLIHKVRFTDETDKKSFVDVGLNYDGGTTYPFFLSFQDGGSSFKMTASLDSKADSLKVDGSLSYGSDKATTGNFSVTVKPGTGPVNVTAPTGAISLTEALSRLGLTQYFNQLLQSATALSTQATGGAGYTAEELQMLQSLSNLQ